MPYDANLILQASVTKTSSFNSTSISLRNPTSTTNTNRGGTPRRGLKARVDVTAISGTPTSVIFKIQHSDDNSTFYDLAYENNGGGFSASTGTDTISFDTDKPWIRLVMTLTGGSSPSVTYSADLGIARP